MSFGAAAFRVAAAFFGSSALLFLAAVAFVVVARARGLDALFVFVTHLPGAPQAARRPRSAKGSTRKESSFPPPGPVKKEARASV